MGHLRRLPWQQQRAQVDFSCAQGHGGRWLSAFLGPVMQQHGCQHGRGLQPLHKIAICNDLDPDRGI